MSSTPPGTARAGSHDPATVFTRTVTEAVRQAKIQLQNDPGLIVYTSITATTAPWSGITGTPTTLAGYGITSPLDVAEGGTGLASYAIGDTLYASAATTLTKLGIGTAAQFLNVNGGATAPQWHTLVATDITNPAALTKTDDTNVTLTLGGTPASALLQGASITVGWTGTLAAARLNANVVQAITNDTNVTGTIAAQTLTLAWSGQLAVGRGGTGLSTFTAAGGIAYATAATALAVLAIGAANTVMLSTGSAPSWAAQSTLTAPAGLLTGTTLAANVVTSSLTTIGTLVGGQVNAQFVTSGTFGSASGDVGTYTFSHALTVTGLTTLTGGFLGGAVGRITTNDQASARLSVRNTTGNKTWDLIAGKDGANNTSFQIKEMIGGIGAMEILATGEVFFPLVNTNVGGGLIVTGAATLDTGAVGSSFGGAVSIGTTLVVTGLLAASAAVTVGTTLGVTGATTFAAGVNNLLGTQKFFKGDNTTNTLYSGSAGGGLAINNQANTLQLFSITDAGVAAFVGAVSTGALTATTAVIGTDPGGSQTFRTQSGHFGGAVLMDSTLTLTGGATFNSFTQFTNGTAPATGAGVEISYGAGVGHLVAFNRTGGAYTVLDLDSSALNLNTNNTGLVTVGGAFTNVGAATLDTGASGSSFGGALNVVGNLSVATNKFTVASATGNTVIAGTLVATSGTDDTHKYGSLIGLGSVTTVFPTLTNGLGTVYALAGQGLVLAGKGTVNDIIVYNSIGGLVMSVATGTVQADFAGNITVAGGQVALGGSITFVSGSTSGSARFAQPQTGIIFKQVIIYLDTLLGTASYTFPTAFSFAPQVVSQSLAARVTSISTTAVTVTGVTSTGFIELNGF